MCARRHPGGAPCSFAYTCSKIVARGYALDSATQTFRTVTLIWAPILSSFIRIVLHCALESSVPSKPMRRSALISRYAIDEK